MRRRARQVPGDSRHDGTIADAMKYNFMQDLVFCVHGSICTMRGASEILNLLRGSRWEYVRFPSKLLVRVLDCHEPRVASGDVREPPG